MTLTIGQVLHDRYRIDALLGEGGMGAVFRAWDLRLRIVVIVKENRVDTPEAQRQFAREAGLLASLRHSRLPRVTDHFHIPGQGQYLVMDYIAGEDLKQILRRQGKVPQSPLSGLVTSWIHWNTCTAKVLSTAMSSRPMSESLPRGRFSWLIWLAQAVRPCARNNRRSTGGKPRLCPTGAVRPRTDGCPNGHLLSGRNALCTVDGTDSARCTGVHDAQGRVGATLPAQSCHLG